MRILYCLDGANIEQLSQALSAWGHLEEHILGLLYVTDSGPHAEIERKRRGLLRPRHLEGPLAERMRAAEGAASQDILSEGLRFFPGAQMLHRDGRPEREIVLSAAEWPADLLVLCSRSPANTGPISGPRSVGHVARFVLDHAPCPVLLVRPSARSAFSLPPAPPRP